MPQNLSALKLIAFFQRIGERVTGKRKRFEFGSNLAQRSRWCLNQLSETRPPWRHRVALLNLDYDFDLLNEEHALVPEVLEFQLRVCLLAEIYPETREYIRNRNSFSPLQRLCFAAIAQAEQQRATGIAFNLQTGPNGCIAVLYYIDGAWHEAITGPADLESALRGCLMRLSRLGYPASKELIDIPLPDYPDFRMTWVSADRFECHLGLAQSNVQPN